MLRPPDIPLASDDRPPTSDPPRPPSVLIEEIEAALGAATVRSFDAGLHRLHSTNGTIWHLEDLVRSSAGDDSRVADLKRKIDAENLARNDLIALLDRDVRAALGEFDVALTPITETPGLTLDRLSVLSLRVTATDRRAASDADQDVQATTRLVAYQRDLELGLAANARDLVRRRRRLPRATYTKLYGQQSTL